MASLNIHQSKSGDPDRLGFHPDCPTCRQDRLFGALSPEPFFVRRLPVLLVTGVLALSASAVATSVAAEPDGQQEGVSAPEHQTLPAPDDPTGDTPGPSTDPDAGAGEDPSSDDLGPGSGGETALPFEIAPQPRDPQADEPTDGVDETLPLESEPAEDPDGRLILTNPDAPGSLNPEEAPVPPIDAAPPVAPAPPAAPVPGADDPTQSPEVEPPAPDPEPNTDQSNGGDKRDRLARDESGSGRNESGSGRNESGSGRSDSGGPGSTEPREHARQDSGSPAPPPPPTDGPALSVVSQPKSASTVEAVAPPPGVGRFHVVRPGESLWSIATNLLGPGASAAAIALQVHRLWALNEERIGTGDPNVLIVGVRLRLR